MASLEQTESGTMGIETSDVIARLESAGLDVEHLSKTLEEKSGMVTRLEQEIKAMRAELMAAYRTRDTLGWRLRALFGSWIWRSANPAFVAARILGKLRITLDQLVPLTDMQRGENGCWEGSGLPHLLIPIWPTKGWVRLRAKVRSNVTSRACLYFDTGHGFHQREFFELSPVAGETVIDRIVPLRTTTYLIRFDPIQQRGEFAVEEFLLEPLSRIGLNLKAVAGNLRRSILGDGTHRPSIWLGLRLLLKGDFSTFHRQLLTNAGGASAASDYEVWLNRHQLTDDSIQQMRSEMAAWQNPPKISIILPVYNVPEEYLRACIESVTSQIYPHWELCIADDASPKPHVRRVLQEYAAGDSRIKVAYREKNGNISAASNSALEMATGEYTALLDHDDEITPHALFKVAEAIVRDRSLDMIYSDEDKLTPDGKRHDPFFKPDWSPEYFTACMYTCHLGTYRTELLRKVGGWRSEFDRRKTMTWFCASSRPRRRFITFRMCFITGASFPPARHRARRPSLRRMIAPRRRCKAISMRRVAAGILKMGQAPDFTAFGMTSGAHRRFQW